MAEVIGAISAILGILDAVKKVYEKVADASRLPKAFERIFAQIDLAWNILTEAEERFKKSQTQELDKIRGTLDICKDDAVKLQKLYVIVCEHAESNWFRRYKREVENMVHDRSHKVEDLWKHLLETLQVLTAYQVFYNLPTPSQDLEQAIRDIEDVADSMLEPEPAGQYTFNAPVNNVHSGSGENKSQNQLNTGSGGQWQGGTHHHGPIGHKGG